MQVVDKSISLAELDRMSEKMFERLVKAVVDIEKGLMVIDADMHSDQEEFMLEEGSMQEHLWGINIIPHKYGTEEFIVFDSMINVRPSWGNRSRSVENPEARKKIVQIVNRLVKPC